MHIALVARDGYIDLFPKIAENISRNSDVKSTFLCHTEDEAAYLKQTYNIDATIISIEVLKNIHPTTDYIKELNALIKEFDAIPIARCFWSGRFEMGMNDSELYKQAVAQIYFWQEFFIKNKIDVLIYERPSILSSCIAWLVCQRLGIKSIDLLDLPIDTITLVSNWSGDYSHELLEKMNQIDKSSSHYQKADAYLNQMLNRPNKTQEALMTAHITEYRAKINLSRISKLIKYIRLYKKNAKFYLYNRPLTKFMWRHIRYWMSYHCHRFINVFQKANPDQDDYFILPLHMMGEWSNHIWAKLDYWDVYKMVSHMAQCLPPGTKLYVKEHYSMYAERSWMLYKRIKKIPNVVLLSPKEDTFSLIKKCRGVCTLGSTLGFEAMLLGKPVILMGDVWYKSLKGIYLADTVYDLTYLMQRSHELYLPTREEKLEMICGLFMLGVNAVKVPREGCLTPNNIESLSHLILEYLNRFAVVKSPENEKMGEVA